MIDKTGKIRGMFDATSKSQCERLHTLLLELLEEEPPQRPGREQRRRAEECDLTMLLAAAHPIVHVNATLNAAAAVLLLVGLAIIKQRPRRRPTSARCSRRSPCRSRFWPATSGITTRSAASNSRIPASIRYVYYAILASHVLLAITVPLLAIWTIYLGLRATGCCSAAATQAEAASRRRRLPRPPPPPGPLDVPDLALRLGDRRGRLRDALSPLATGGFVIYNPATSERE